MTKRNITKKEKRTLHSIAMGKERGIAEARYGKEYYLPKVKKAAKARYKKIKI